MTPEQRLDRLERIAKMFVSIPSAGRDLVIPSLKVEATTFPDELALRDLDDNTVSRSIRIAFLAFNLVVTG